MKTILVTGGAGYVGSHTVVQLLNEGFEVVVVDNFSNSKPQVMHAVQQITGKQVHLYPIDLCDEVALRKVFQDHQIDGVIHFAGLKSVGESAKIPLTYYRNNLIGTLNLLEQMQANECFDLVFSSSATVYGLPQELPITEETPVNPINTYGRTKVFIEQFLQDMSSGDARWRIMSLRFFNPLGAHQSGDLGEDPQGLPNNLAPYITQIAVGRLDKLMVFGNDFKTPDGTSVRDYLHVEDLAQGHIAALKYLLESANDEGFEVVNLGSGKGYSVLEMIHSFEKVTGKKIPYAFEKRRPGDAPQSYASVEKAKVLLNWVPAYSIEQMCADTWRWQQKHPNGYDL